MSKTILVTGAGGFIGNHLCSELVSKGYRVVGIDLQYPEKLTGLTSENSHMVTGDFRNRQLMKELLHGVATVFHLASAHLQINLTDSEYRSVNVNSLEPLMEMTYQSGVKRLVHVSSVGVYGNLKELPADEETPCKPRNIYGETKLAGEAVVKKFYENTGMPIVILRPAWVFGPRCMRTLKIYKTLRRGHFVLIGKGDNLRHPVYIQDMLTALILSMESDNAVGETILIGGNQTLTTKELLNSFCSILDLPRPKIKLPMKIAEVIAFGFETVFGMAGKEPPLSTRSLEFFNTNNSFNISRAKQLLGFNPEFTFEEGLKESREWLEESVSQRLLK